VLMRAVTDAGAVRRSRRSWSRDEKRRIVDETFRPGASVADMARRHGLNVARAEDEAPAAIAEASPRPATSLPRSTAACSVMAERAGVIEIELVDGTRLRVDAFVTERALRRVLVALKAAGA